MGSKSSKNNEKSKFPTNGSDEKYKYSTYKNNKIKDDFVVIDYLDNSKEKKEKTNNINNNITNDIKNDNSKKDININKNTISNKNKNETKIISEKPKTDFELYFIKDSETGEEILDEDGLLKIGNDLKIDIYTHMFFPYFFYLCKAKNLEKITKSEYKNGLNFFHVDSIKKLTQSNLNSWKMKIDNSKFKDYYIYLFNLNVMKKIVSFEVVELYFKNFFSEYKFVNEFIDFLKNEKKECGLNKDQWTTFIDLIKTVKNNFPQNYSIEDAWPNLFDEFYYYYCKKHGIEIPKNNEDEEEYPY